jgi:hypothetical protein
MQDSIEVKPKTKQKITKIDSIRESEKNPIWQGRSFCKEVTVGWNKLAKDINFNEENWISIITRNVGHRE